MRHNTVRSLSDRFGQGSSVVPLISAICEWVWFSDGTCTHLAQVCKNGEWIFLYDKKNSESIICLYVFF
jgi:hypothetical protein